MPDWTKSMEQTFEYYTVDPGTWRDMDRMTNIKSCSISRDSETNTLGSATIDVISSVGECYIRIYLITIQNGVRERFPLGTFLVQTPSSSFDGKIRTVTMDAYTPLIELKENPPPLGYTIFKNENIMEMAYKLVKENARAPVVRTTSSDTLFSDFIANTDDTWITFLSDLIANAKYNFDLDELGRILFAPKQELTALQPVWTFNDDNSSILQPDFSMTHDLYGIPNTVEVTYASNTGIYSATVVNDDPNSPVSTVNRGRTILHRVTDPSFTADPTKSQVEEYAKQLLEDLSTLECSISFTHGYCPIRLGDCVRLNYSRAGAQDIKAKVISQNIKCTSGCQVSTKAIFTTKLWG